MTTLRVTYGLEALKISKTSFGDFLVPVINNKFPPVVKRSLTRNTVTSSFHTGIRRADKKPVSAKAVCVYCKGCHVSTQCDTVTDTKPNGCCKEREAMF